MIIVVVGVALGRGMFMYIISHAMLLLFLFACMERFGFVWIAHPCYTDLCNKNRTIHSAKAVA